MGGGGVVTGGACLRVWLGGVAEGVVWGVAGGVRSRIWLGGVARDVVGGVLWREFSGGKSCKKPKIQDLTRSSDTFGHV